MAEEMNHDMKDFQSVQEGDVVTGKVTNVQEKHALVDIGYKVDAILPISELSSLHIEKVGDMLSEGDELQVKVTKLSEDEVVVSKREVEAEKAWEDLKEKYEQSETFDVTVADVVKGGLVADIGVRGFIPASLVERHYVENFEDYKGQALQVKIAEFDPENNKVILSHRAVLDDEASKKKEDTLQELHDGDVLTGTVQRLTDFGAFVDIGGIDGLVHISQLSHHHVETPSEVVEEGQEVKVKVLSVDRENERISLSIKDTLPGPWEQIGQDIKVGDVVEGTVKRLVTFGAFVEVAPGVEGLVHISEISNQHIGTPNEVLEEGQEVQVKVLDVDLDEKRISLSMKEFEEPEEAEPESPAKGQQAAMEDDDSTSGFSIEDMIGDKLKKYK